MEGTGYKYGTAVTIGMLLLLLLVLGVWVLLGNAGRDRVDGASGCGRCGWEWRNRSLGGAAEMLADNYYESV
jgi:hypothetical protein